MIEIERYSFTAFEPRIQHHHLQTEVYPYLYNEEFKKELEFFKDNERMIRFLKEKYKILHPFFKDNFYDFTEGIWVFIKGYKNNISLNHLNRRVPCFIAEAPDDLECYFVNWSDAKRMRLDDPLAKAFGVYIPKREISKISNIRKLEKMK